MQMLKDWVFQNISTQQSVEILLQRSYLPQKAPRQWGTKGCLVREFMMELPAAAFRVPGPLGENSL